MAPSTFAAVQAMEDLGYVVRKQKPDNRKTVYIHLTPLGRSLEAELVPLAVEVNDVATQGLSARQIDAFRETLITIIENLEQHSAIGREAETPATFGNKRKGVVGQGQGYAVARKFIRRATQRPSGSSGNIRAAVFRCPALGRADHPARQAEPGQQPDRQPGQVQFPPAHGRAAPTADRRDGCCASLRRWLRNPTIRLLRLVSSVSKLR